MKALPKNFDECLRTQCENCRAWNPGLNRLFKCSLFQDFVISNNIAQGTHTEYEPSTKRAYHYRAVNEVKKWGIPFICERCGTQTGIEVHHIDRNPKNNKIDNLEVLCKYCHREEHNQEKRYYEE